MACTSAFGTGLAGAFHGRLDGELISVVPPGTSACNGDPTHLHLQVRMGGQPYDVAVNLDALTDELDIPLPGPAFAEGWHAPEALDYVALGQHSAAFTASTPAALRARLEALLQNVNHVSVFATRYGPDGTHLVHRNGGTGNDGALVLQPLSGAAHVVLFAFSNQSF